jgi:hypothetical protein
MATALILWASPVLAQHPLVVVSGIVTDPDGRPVGGAIVVAPGSGLSVLSDREGRFQLNAVRPGVVRFEARRIGYRTSFTTLQLESGVHASWDVRLERAPLELPPITVSVVRAATPQIEGFYQRRDRVPGTFFTRNDIETMHARQVTDVLRRVPGARLLPVAGPFGTTHVLQLGRSLGNPATQQPCPILYYVNGVPFHVRLDIGIDALLRADDIQAIEVYSGTARVPAQFHSSANATRCGVVVIWTRAGEGMTGREPR